MSKTLITGGTIVTAADMYEADVLLDGEKIAQIGTGLVAGGAGPLQSPLSLFSKSWRRRTCWRYRRASTIKCC